MTSLEWASCELGITCRSTLWICPHSSPCPSAGVVTFPARLAFPLMLAAVLSGVQVPGRGADGTRSLVENSTSSCRPGELCCQCWLRRQRKVTSCRAWWNVSERHLTRKTFPEMKKAALFGTFTS